MENTMCTLLGGHGDKKRFTVRKMSGTVGVERIFPIESPAIDSITVIPEIDLPGHMQAALTAYPNLGCTGCLLYTSRCV